MSTTSTIADARRTARDAFGWDTLLPGQAEAIASVVAGRDTLVVFPTGAGKSAVYQIAGLELGGVTVVISPLLALQRDQIASIDAAPDAPAAVAVNSRTSARALSAAWAAVESGEPVYLFLAPEQLARDEVLDRLVAADVRLVVVDEAHCVSAWGHDFRPDYVRIGEAVEALGHPPVLALTATASTPVRTEIVERLGMRDAHIDVRGIDRPEIRLTVRRHEDDAEKRRAVLDEVATEGGPTLLYVATRKDTERYADELAQRGRRTAAYHGAMASRRRDEVHAAWTASELDVVVATSAFGMGIDKPDVRLVAHADVTESLDAYVQEIGRAARDGEPARAVLHYRPEDFSVRSFFAGGRTRKDDVGAVWEALAEADGPVRATAVADTAGLSSRVAARILNGIVTAGAATAEPRGFLPVKPRRVEDVVEAVREGEEAQRRIRESRIAIMRGYAETTGCRRRALLEYFGVEAPDRCENCDRCDALADRDEDSTTRFVAAGARAGDDEVHVDDAVEHREWGHGTVVSVEDDRMTVFFDEQGYKVVAREALERGIVDVEDSARA
ncbi:RecQ family ATP-dependent DNA helicase [Labedella phragmitis]|uniref:ATP-dependent DNA helicase RecQ n=1 Tax=Labedella phragmitis TaxID=2498849 RepID=A0A3S4DM86_9MICO|nr:RecQ family ATP-dependent DNA helicase [Labedella phragmitis]RWZ51560.1 RecQ family ATP-dependent DNA helicase [Labedella phragmitis]